MFDFNQLLENLKLPTWIFSFFTLDLLFQVFAWIFLFSGSFAVIYFLIKWHLSRKLHQLPQIIFEVKPLRITEQNPQTTEQMFNLIHGLAKQSSWIYRLFYW